LLGALAGDDEPVARPWKVSAVERKGFRDSAACADQELHERAIPFFVHGLCRQRGEQAGELIRIDRFGQPLLELWERDAVGEVAVDQAFLRNPAQPRADRDESART